jgi:subtilisin family serine protease
MAGGKASSRRYVILPGQGIAGRAMQAAVFQERSAENQARVLSERYGLLRGVAASAPFASDSAPVSPVPPALGADEFRILSQRFEDGPALVSMTEEARWALEATYPGLRVVEVTRYYLPGISPQHRKTVRAAAVPAGQSAMLPGTGIFLDDAKQYALRTWPPGSTRDGEDVLVGLIDTGVDSTHPALAPQVLALRCMVPGTAPGAGGPVDWGPSGQARAGHGTHVAGIVCALPGFGGPPGVAPKARVVSYRVYPDNPGGPPSPAENIVIIDAIRAAIEDGCHIINLSLEGASLKDDGVSSAISDAWNQGVICVAAAGNGFGLPVSYPAALPHCVAVTAMGRVGSFPPIPAFDVHVSKERSAVDPDIFLATFSNYGPRVQFTAPGHAIVSTFPGGQWWFESGTSMSAPFVSGVLARALSDTPAVLGSTGNAQRSAAMIQLLVGVAMLLNMPQKSHEGWGWPR